MRGTPSALARLAVVLAVTGLAGVIGSGPAAAGGPTSVLLASPFTDSAVGLYYTDDDYARLQSLLGGPDLPAASSPPPAAAGSPHVTVTWLVHDASPWRIDRVFLGEETWVVSQLSTGDPLTGAGMYPGETGALGAVWHPPADPAALTALLSALGLVPGSAGAASPPAAAAVEAAAVEPSPAVPQATAATAAPSGWWLPAIGGLLAGLVIGGAIVRLRSTRDASGRRPATADPAAMLPFG